MKRIGILTLLLLLTGCSNLTPIPQSSSGDISPQEAWASTLKDYVNDRGQVDFNSLDRNPDKLNAYVHYLSIISPESHPAKFPAKEDRLAYYINSYNALAMYGIIDAGIPESLTGLQKVQFFYFRKFVLGGREVSLYDYENKVIRPVGDERVHFALNCMSVGCPVLPRQPFYPQTLDKVLEEETRKFFSEERNLRVDDQKQQVWVSEILDFFTEDFAPSAQALIPYLNRYSSRSIPEHYRVRFIPYDWTVNNSTEK
ncbi:MAG: DUF547 domain-containing protein [Endozoicomonas sp.]